METYHISVFHCLVWWDLLLNIDVQYACLSTRLRHVVVPGYRCDESSGHGEMMDVETSYSDFISCDRTGRRNAVPDIAGQEAGVSATELTKDMAEMDLKAGAG